MDSYSEVRRVRKEMSARAGHDIRALIASINSRWPDDASHAIDPGTKAESMRCTRSRRQRGFGWRVFTGGPVIAEPSI